MEYKVIEWVKLLPARKLKKYSKKAFKYIPIFLAIYFYHHNRQLEDYNELKEDQIKFKEEKIKLAEHYLNKNHALEMKKLESQYQDSLKTARLKEQKNELKLIEKQIESKNYEAHRRQKELEELDKLAVKIMEADKLENLVNFSTMDNESYRKHQEVRVDKRHYINLLEVKAANLDRAEVWKPFIEKMRSPKLTRDRFYGSTTGI